MIMEVKNSKIYKSILNTQNFFFDMKKYSEYIRYSVSSGLKAQLSSTHLGWFWWVLDPLMYMLVYILMVSVIMNKGKENFPVFVFCALLSWKWTSGALLDSTKSIKSNIRLLEQVYIPKVVLVLIKVFMNTIKYLVGNLVLIGLILIYGIEITPHIFEFIFVFSVNMTMIIGISCFLSHLGVYFKDITNVLMFSLRLWFYVSPAIYSVSDIPPQIAWLWTFNPMTVIFEGYRDVFLYGRSPDYLALLIWLSFFTLVSIVGIRCLNKHDKKYVKVV